MKAPRIGKTFYVSRTILRTFRGPPPKGWVAIHRNNKLKDNREPNVVWLPRKAMKDREHEKGTKLYGERCHTAKLKDDDVVEIKRMRHHGAESGDIYPLYKHIVARRQILRILDGTNWQFVTYDPSMDEYDS